MKKNNKSNKVFEEKEKGKAFKFVMVLFLVLFSIAPLYPIFITLYSMLKK